MKTLNIILSLLALLCLFSTESEARLAANSRRAVVLEAYHALRPQADGVCEKTIGSNCVSNWNFIADDWNAYNTMKSQYRCDSSIWSRSGDGSGCSNPDKPISFYSDIWGYGYSTAGGSAGNVGRGGQCKFFSNLVLYRSGTDSRKFPSYSTMWGNTEANMAKLREGDVILTYQRGITQHVAIVTSLDRNSSGSITAATVVDSNFITDTSGYGREVIGRHKFGIDTLKAYYRIYKGVSYYNDPYALY